MLGSINSRIAGVDIRISYDTTACESILKDFLKDFIVNSCGKDPFDVRFSADKSIIELGFKHTDREKEMNAWGLTVGMGHIDKNGDHAVLVDATPESVEVAGFVMDNLLRIALQYAMPKRGGVLLHSSAIVHEGKSLVFIASNEGGKSTISANSGKPVLSDDCVGMQGLPDGGFLACATPWGRVHGKGEYPIEAMFFIEKSDKFFCEPVSSIDTVKKVFSNLSLTFSDIDKSSDTILDNILGVVTSLSMDVPAYRLGFRKDDNVIEMLGAGHWVLGAGRRS